MPRSAPELTWSLSGRQSHDRYSEAPFSRRHMSPYTEASSRGPRLEASRTNHPAFRHRRGIVVVLAAVLFFGILTLWVPAYWPVTVFQVGVFTLAAVCIWSGRRE